MMPPHTGSILLLLWVVLHQSSAAAGSIAAVDCGYNATGLSNATLDVASNSTLDIRHCAIGVHFTDPIQVHCVLGLFDVAMVNVTVRLYNVSGIGRIVCDASLLINVSIDVSGGSTMGALEPPVPIVALAASLRLQRVAVSIVDTMCVAQKPLTANAALLQIVANGVSDHIRIVLRRANVTVIGRPDYKGFASHAVHLVSTGSLQDVSVEVLESLVALVLEPAIAVDDLIPRSVLRHCVLYLQLKTSMLRSVFVVHNTTFRSWLTEPYFSTWPRTGYSGDVSLLRIEGSTDGDATVVRDVAIALTQLWLNASAQVGVFAISMEDLHGGVYNASMSVHDTTFGALLDGEPNRTQGIRQRTCLLFVTGAVLAQSTVDVHRLDAVIHATAGTRYPSIPFSVDYANVELISFEHGYDLNVTVVDVSMAVAIANGWFMPRGSTLSALTITVCILSVHHDVGSTYSFDDLNVAVRNITLTATTSVQLWDTYAFGSGSLMMATMFALGSSMHRLKIRVDTAVVRQTAPALANLLVLRQWLFPSLLLFMQPEYLKYEAAGGTVDGTVMTLSNVDIQLRHVHFECFGGFDLILPSYAAPLAFFALGALLEDASIKIIDSVVASRGSAGATIVELVSCVVNGTSRIVIESSTLVASSILDVDRSAMQSASVGIVVDACNIVFYPPSSAGWALTRGAGVNFLRAAPHQHQQHGLFRILHNRFEGFVSLFNASSALWPSSAQVSIGCNTWRGAGASEMQALPPRVVHVPRWAVSYPPSSFNGTACYGSSFSHTVSPSKVLANCYVGAAVSGTTFHTFLYQAVRDGGVRVLLTVTPSAVVEEWHHARSVPLPTTSWGAAELLVTNATSGYLFLTVGAVASVFATQQATVRIPLPPYCADNASVLRVTYVATTPPIPLAVRTAAQVATVTVGALASIFGRGGVGTAMLLQRSMLAQQLSVCEFTDEEALSVADSPTQLAFGPLEGAYLRGAVVGNAALWLAFALVVAASATFRVWRRSEELTREHIAVQCNMSGLPGIMATPLVLLLQPTVASGIALLSGRFTSIDVFYGLWGLSIPCAMVMWFAVRTCVSFSCKAQMRSCSSSNDVRRTVVPQRAAGARPLTRQSTLFFQPRVLWVPSRSTPPYYLEAYGGVFEEYTCRRHWFFGVESAIAVAAGVVAGIRPRTESGCTVLLWLNLALAAVGVGTVALWPYRSAHGNAHYALGNGAAAACALLLLADANAASDWIAVGLTLVVVVSSFSDMAAAGHRIYQQWASCCVKGRLSPSFLRFLIQRIRNGGLFAQSTTSKRRARSPRRVGASPRDWMPPSLLLLDPSAPHPTNPLECTRRLGVLVGLICDGFDS